MSIPEIMATISEFARFVTQTRLRGTESKRAPHVHEDVEAAERKGTILR
jgi:hypothetical protein